MPTPSGTWSSGVLDKGLGLYVHWPFCRSKCPYCDFNSHAVTTIDQALWRHALVTELAFWRSHTAGRTITSVFFGGGTPSLMAPETVAGLLDAVADGWPLAPDLEVTLEANPTSAEAAAFAGFRAAGVNRLSLGVQALDDAALAALGRGHDTKEALAAIDLASRCFERVSIDLIYARPGQTPVAWRRELGLAVTLGTGHLSAYQLSIEPGTAFHRQEALGALTLPDEEIAADLFEATQEMLAACGLPAYEISNHARPGQECRHNLAIWQGGDYLGIGPGAHGRLDRPDGGRLATQCHRAPGDWLAQVKDAGHGTLPPEPLDATDRLEELLLFGLRLTEGVRHSTAHARLGYDLLTRLDPGTLARLIEGGFLALDPAGLRATPAGRQRLNAVLAALL